MEKFILQVVTTMKSTPHPPTFVFRWLVSSNLSGEAAGRSSAGLVSYTSSVSFIFISSRFCHASSFGCGFCNLFLPSFIISVISIRQNHLPVWTFWFTRACQKRKPPPPFSGQWLHHSNFLCLLLRKREGKTRLQNRFCWETSFVSPN